MNTKDLHYYNSLNPFYDWEKHMINVGCQSKDLNFLDPSKPITEEGEKNASVFVHEYIHYLQNFSTTWGSLIFKDFTFALIQIGASSSDDKKILNIPLNKLEINELFLKGLQLRDEVRDKVNKLSIAESEDGTNINFKFINVNNEYLTLTNGRTTIPLSGKVIREHMANMGTLLFLGKNDTEIHEHNRDFKGFIKNNLEFSEQPEYWILFEYFHTMGVFSNLAKGIFYLTQQCLATHSPEKALKRFNIFLSQTNNKSQTDFITLVQQWQSSVEEQIIFADDLEKSLYECNYLINIAEKKMHENHLLEFAYKILIYIKKNIIKTNGGRKLFLTSDNLGTLSYWNKKLNVYGSGLVRYLDDIMIHGNDDHCRTMEECFLFLISSSFVLNKILNNQKSNCPFLEDIPICKAEYKGEDNCYINPFEMIKNEHHGKECVFVNGIFLLGLQNRTRFN